MEFTQEGEWTVSTPIVAGPAEAVSRAVGCAHGVWGEETRAIEQGHLMVLERCATCKAATRVRYRPERPGDQERKP
jgi:hypothetical protein